MNDSGKSEQERVPHFLHKTCKLGSFWTFQTEGETTALVLTRNEKAIARLSLNSFPQGGPGFQVRILLTFAVTAAVTLFDQPLA